MATYKKRGLVCVRTMTMSGKTTGACVVKNMLAGPIIPQGWTHSYYPWHFNRYFPRQNVDRTQIATDLRSEMIFLQRKPSF